MYRSPASSVPLEIRMVLNGLGNELSLTVFVTLLNGGEMSFSELKKRLDLEGSALTYQLDRLMGSALVEHYYRHELGNERYSFYAVTEFGRRFYCAMVDALMPEAARKLLDIGEKPIEVEDISLVTKHPIRIRRAGRLSKT